MVSFAQVDQLSDIISISRASSAAAYPKLLSASGLQPGGTEGEGGGGHKDRPRLLGAPRGGSGSAHHRERPPLTPIKKRPPEGRGQGVPADAGGEFCVSMF